jgi:hypothetical protein
VRVFCRFPRFRAAEGERPSDGPRPRANRCLKLGSLPGFPFSLSKLPDSRFPRNELSTNAGIAPTGYNIQGPLDHIHIRSVECNGKRMQCGRAV